MQFDFKKQKIRKKIWPSLLLKWISIEANLLAKHRTKNECEEIRTTLFLAGTFVADLTNQQLIQRNNCRLLL